MDVLLTFTGFHDPFSASPDGEEHVGPVLSLVSERAFDRVVLFSTPKTDVITTETRAELATRHPQVDTVVIDLPLIDPTDYVEILEGLRSHTRRLIEETPDVRLTVSVTSGTPHMHACWLLLVASGEIPADLVNVRPTRFVSRDRPLVMTVDYTSSEFPVVRSGTTRISIPDADRDAADVAAGLGMVGDHPEFLKALDAAALVAESASPVLVTGETGTGKDLVAQFVHLMSDRHAGAFVPVNCAALPPELVESILFGHRRGAFTGASTDHVGKFVQADGGTLFLDELAELPSAAQAKLLRVLQDGVVEPVGDSEPIQTDVRIVGATNRNLAEAVRAGEFREDLYYRLNVGEVRLPALRERSSDIPKIALHVLDRVNKSLRSAKSLLPEALVWLQRQPWPGNVRDLANTIERSAMMTRVQTLGVADLIPSESTGLGSWLTGLPAPHEGFSLEGVVSDVRSHLFGQALAMSGGNQTRAAQLLDVTPQAVSKHVRTTHAAQDPSATT